MTVTPLQGLLEVFKGKCLFYFPSLKKKKKAFNVICATGRSGEGGRFKTIKFLSSLTIETARGQEIAISTSLAAKAAGLTVSGLILSSIFLLAFGFYRKGYVGVVGREMA